MTRQDPIRWLDDTASPLSADEREALQGYALACPSAEQHARMWSALDSATSVASPRLGPGRRIWWWSGALGLAAIALWWTLAGRPAPAVRPAAPRTPLSQQSVAAPVAAEAVGPVAAPTPLVAQPPASATARSAPPRRAQAGSEAGQLRNPGAELALLSPARQLLATAPARALTLADEHARRFPRGVFAEERAFLRIEALLRLGRVEPASNEAERFRRQYPRSSYRERLRQLLLTAREEG